RNSGGTLTLGGNLSGGAITFDGAGGTTANGVISGGTTSITKTGAATLILNGNNTFGGGVTLSAGVLQLGNAGALNSTTPNAVAFSSASTATLRLNGFNLTVPSLTTTGTAGGTVENGAAGTATLTSDVSSG